MFYSISHVYLFLKIYYFINLFTLNESLNILSLVHTPVRSHHIFNRKLNIELATKGHNVTVISAFEETHPIINQSNYHHYVVKAGIDVQNVFNYNVIGEQNDYSQMFDWVDQYCKSLMFSVSLQKIIETIKGDNFDVIIYELALKDCTLGFVKLLNYPTLVGISPIGFTPWISLLTKNPEYSSNMPYYLANKEPPFTTFEKIMNNLLNLRIRLMYNTWHLPKMTYYSTQIFKRNIPSIDTYLYNTSLFLINSNWAKDYPRLLSPEVIPVGGLHLDKPNPLPKNLAKWLDDSNEGVIIFSLGSILNYSHIKNRINMFITAFSKMKQRILWKLDKQLDNIPPNIKIVDWYPQEDVLSHKNVRLFITHAGIMSSYEAIYHGVPVLAIPFFLDQNSNALKLTERGMGITLNINKLTLPQLIRSMNQIINESSFKKAALDIRKFFLDVPMKPLDLAVYWVEYVGRHGGAKHLRLPFRDYSWYNFEMFDIYFGITIQILIAIFIAKIIFEIIIQINKEE